MHRRRSANTDMLAVTSMPRNWSLEWVTRPPLRIFNPPLIYLSHPALDRLVPLRGDAPRSAGYRPAALLLSYRGMKMKWRSTRESHSGRLCGAQRFSGPFPRLCRTCSVSEREYGETYSPLFRRFVAEIVPSGECSAKHSRSVLNGAHTRSQTWNHDRYKRRMHVSLHLVGIKWAPRDGFAPSHPL